MDLDKALKLYDMPCLDYNCLDLAKTWYRRYYRIYWFILQQPPLEEDIVAYSDTCPWYTSSSLPIRLNLIKLHEDDYKIIIKKGIQVLIYKGYLYMPIRYQLNRCKDFTGNIDNYSYEILDAAITLSYVYNTIMRKPLCKDFIQISIEEALTTNKDMIMVHYIHSENFKLGKIICIAPYRGNFNVTYIRLDDQFNNTKEYPYSLAVDSNQTEIQDNRNFIRIYRVDPISLDAI